MADFFTSSCSGNKETEILGDCPPVTQDIGGRAWRTMQSPRAPARALATSSCFLVIHTHLLPSPGSYCIPTTLALLMSEPFPCPLCPDFHMLELLVSDLSSSVVFPDHQLQMMLPPNQSYYPNLLSLQHLPVSRVINFLIISCFVSPNKSHESRICELMWFIHLNSSTLNSV